MYLITKFEYEYAEIKLEIQQVLDKVPEDLAGSKKPEQIVLSDYIKKILAEDKQLLEKLAT